MVKPNSKTIQKTVDEIYRSESRRVFATLIRLLGDFDLAEEAMHDAFIAAVEKWEVEGVPENPRAWLVSTGRFKAIDTIRRRQKFNDSKAEIMQRQQDVTATESINDESGTEDDRLRLIFTCCHPALSPETQVALTLREVCGLKTEEIASACLTSASTIAQRIVRGKAKIREARIPYRAPSHDELPDRLDSVLAVIYLVFNEGYAATAGDSLTRTDLSEEAIRLGRLLVELLPDPEVMGLLALMVLQESRREARTSETGDLILLEEQDRSRWDQQLINEGQIFVQRSLAAGPCGTYTLQAAIASVHAAAREAGQTDWSQVVAWYDLLLQAEDSPVVRLNRAVAVAMRDGPQAGLSIVEALLEQGELKDYHLAHAARADLYRRLGDHKSARTSYQKALKLAKLEPEIRFLQRRINELA
jgi:RNA polymerase sigma-70 factor (ECF subfamily)